jgi:hypothetical protein
MWNPTDPPLCWIQVQWETLYYIELALSSKTIMDSIGQAYPSSKISFLTEGNCVKFIGMLGVDKYVIHNVNINTKLEQYLLSNREILHATRNGY